MAPSIPTKVEDLPSKEEVKEEAVEATKKTLSGLRSLAAGGVGGVCAVVVGHPFDLVKVRMQTAEKGVYSGAIDVVRKTVAREGLARVCILSCNHVHSHSRLTMLLFPGSLRRRLCPARRRDANVRRLLLGI